MCNINNNGPNTELCGTPHIVRVLSETCRLIIVVWVRSCTYDEKKTRVYSFFFMLIGFH